MTVHIGTLYRIIRNSVPSVAHDPHIIYSQTCLWRPLINPTDINSSHAIFIIHMSIWGANIIYLFIYLLFNQLGPMSVL